MRGERTRVYKTALHRWGKPKFSNNGKERVSDLSQEFHVFAVEWERDGVRWYVDEELVQYRGRFVDKRGRSMPACERVPGEHHSAPYFPRGQDDLSIILDLAVSGAKGFCNGPVQPPGLARGYQLRRGLRSGVPARRNSYSTVGINPRTPMSCTTSNAG